MADDAIGSLRVNVSADLSELQSELGKIPALLSESISGIANVGTAASAALTPAIETLKTAGETAATAAPEIKQAAEALTDIGTAAGKSAPELASVGEAAGQTSESFEDFAARMKSASDEATRELDQLAEAEKGTGEAGSGAAPGLKEFQEQAGETAESLKGLLEKVGLALGVFELLKETLSAFSEEQDITTSFKLLSGSADVATSSIAHLKEMAGELGVSEGTLLDQASKLAPQFGVGTKALYDVMQASADAAAGAHKEFDTVAQAIDRIAVSGQVGSRQLMSLGVSMDDVAKQMGVSSSVAKQMMADTSAGALDAQTKVQVILDTIETKFPEAGKALAEGLHGQFTTLKNEVENLAQDVGGALAPVAEDLIALAKNDIVPFIKGLVDAFTALPKPVQESAIALTALGVALNTLGGMKLLTLAIEAFGASTIAIAAAAGAAGAAVGYLGNKSLDASLAQENANAKWLKGVDAAAALTHGNEGAASSMDILVAAMHSTGKASDDSAASGKKVQDQAIATAAAHATLVAALKAAEDNYSAVQKAVSAGIGTDKDAAAAKQKVVAAMQALHPELQSIFSETDSWNSIIKISNDLIGEQNEELLKLAPTVSKHTALLEAQAASLQTRASLWQRDMQDLQDDGAALAAHSDHLADSAVNMKAFDDVDKLVVKGLEDEFKAIQQLTLQSGPIHDMRMLGIQDTEALAKKLDAEQTALENLANDGWITERQAMEREVGIKQEQIRLGTELGQNTDKLKIELIELGDRLKVNEGFWLSLDKTLHQVSDSLVNDISRGVGHLVFDLFDSSQNDKLNEQMDSLRGALTEAAASYGSTVDELNAKMADLTTTSAANLAQQLADLDSSMVDATAAHRKATDDIEAQMAEVTETNAYNLQKQLADLQQTVSEKKLQYSEDVQNIKDTYAKTTEHIKDSAAQKELDYKHWVETQNVTLKRLEGDNSTSAKKQKEDIQLQLKQRAEDMDLYRSQEKEHLTDAENDLKESLQNREAEYALAMQDLNRKQSEATNDAKIELDKQLSNLQGNLDDENAKYDAFKVEQVQKRKDITDAAAVELAKQQADVQKQLDDATAAFEKYKKDNAAQLTDLEGQFKTSLDKIGDMFSGVFKKAGEDAISSITKSLLEPLGTKFDTLIDGMIKKVSGGAWDEVFKNIPGIGSGIGSIGQDIGKSGTGAIGDIVGTGDTLAGVGSSVGGVAGGIISAGLSSTLGLVAAGIQAATGVVSIFQNMHQETSLNAIESNTRVGALYTLAVLDWTMGIADWNGHAMFPQLVGINTTLSDAWGTLNDISATLSNMFIDIGSIDTHLTNLPLALQGVFQSVTGHVYLDGQEMAASFVTYLTQAGIKMPQS